MPNPQANTPDDLAKRAALLTPDDAAYIQGRMTRYGVTGQDIAQNPQAALKEVFSIENSEKWRDFAASSPDFAAWMDRQMRASIVQKDLDILSSSRDVIQRMKLPDPAGMFDEAGSMLKSSAVAFGTGLAATPAAPISLVHAGLNAISGEADPWDNTLIAKLGTAGLENMERRQEEAEDIQSRTLETGGNRVQLIVGSILGQAPEMLATGFGTALVAKPVVSGITSAAQAVKAGAQAATRRVVGESLMDAAARAAVVSRGAALTAPEIKSVLTAASFMQGAQEGGRALVNRMKGNFDAGEKDLITARDVAVATATAAVVMATELMGGITGEMRLLADGGLMAKTTFKGAVRDALTQIGQESVQEGLPQALEDIIDGRSVDWSEVGWASLAGAIGGGLFGAPAFVAAIRSQVDPANAAKVTAAASAINKLAGAKKVIENADALNKASKALEQSKSVSLQTRVDAAEMFKAMGATGEQFISMEDLTAYAAKFNRTVDEVLAELGGRVEGGMAVVETSQLLVEMSAHPENKEGLLGIVRHSPDSAALDGLHAQITDAVAQVEEIGKQTQGLMPDGVTVDDSADVAAQFEKDLIAAGRPAKNAKMESLLVAEQVRTDADKWNQYADEAGVARVTPKQLFDRVKLTVEAGDMNARGDYTTGVKVLRIGQKSDASTVVHELMHHWLDTHIQWAAQTGAPPIFRKDLYILADYVKANAKAAAKKYEGATADGVTEAARNITSLDLSSPNGRAIHEFVASSFEEYMSEGKPPSKELDGVFSRMKKWFLDVYRTLLRLDRTASIISGNPDERLLSDNARDVFARMLAARDRIAPARARELKAGDFKLTEEGWELVQRSRESAIAEGVADLEKRERRRLAKQEKKDLAAKRAKLEKEATERISALPAYVAKAKLAEGEDPQAVALTFDYPSVEAMMAEVQGADLDAAVKSVVDTELSGEVRKSIDELYEDLKRTGEYRGKLAAVERRATEEAAVLVAKGTEAGEAAAGDRAKDVRAKTMAAVKRNAEMDYEFLAAVAKARVNRMPSRQLDPKRAVALAEAARDRAEAALARQDIAAYQQAKLDEAGAEAMAAALADAQRAWAKEAAIIRKILDSEDKSLRIDIGGRYFVRNKDAGYYKEYSNYVDANRDFQLRQAENGYEFGKTTELAEIRDAIAALMSSGAKTRYNARVRLMAMANDPAYSGVMASEFRWFASQGFGDPDNWTVGQVSIVRYQMETLLSYADTRIKLAMETDATIGALVSAIPDVKEPIKQDKERSALLKGSRWLILSHQDMRSFLQSYGLGDAWVRFIIDPLNNGEAAARDAVEPWLAAVNAAIKPLRATIDKTENIQGLTSKREENLMRVAHWGNTTGRQRVAEDLKARGVARPDEYMRDVIGSLTDGEIGLITAMWTEFDAMWTKQKNAALVSGVAIPPGVTPQEIVLPNGKRLSGGYVRVAYDNEAAFIPDFVTDKGEISVGAIDSTMMKARVDVVEGKMLDLSIEVQEHSAYAHAKYIGYRPVVSRLNFIKNNETLAGATNKLGGDFQRDLWEKVRWAIDGSAKSRKTLDEAAGVLVRNVQSAVYLGNMLTSVKQSVGWVVAVGHKDVGSRGVVTSLQKALTNYEEWARGPSKLSVMMRQRMHYQDLDFRMPSRVKGESEFKYQMRKYAGLPMRFFQYFTDLVVWNGAYMKAVGTGSDQAEAVRVADKAVIDTQGSGLKAEQTLLTRTEMGLLYTFGAKWGIKNANMLYRMWAANPGWDKRQFCYAVIWSLGISTALMAAASAVLQPQDEKDPQKTLSDYSSAAFIDAVASPNIFLRYAIQGLMARSAAEGVATLAGPLKTPAMDFWNVWRSDSWQEVVTRSTGVAGAATGLPSTQLKRFEKAAFEGADNYFELMFKAIFGEEYKAP
jgi:hypothetical protein